VILAGAYRDAGQLDIAVMAAREAIRIAPQSQTARMILASALVRSGWVEDARRIGRELWSLIPPSRLPAISTPHIAIVACLSACAMISGARDRHNELGHVGDFVSDQPSCTSSRLVIPIGARNGVRLGLLPGYSNASVSISMA
jgi:hypothetical protein